MTRKSITIDDKQCVYGQVKNDVIVAAGGRLEQHGQVNGDITVEVGGELEQHGQVNGDLNAHGTATLSGQVNGEVYAHAGSSVLIAEGVMVGSDSSRRYVATDGTFQPVPTGRVFSTRIGPTMWRLNSDGSLSAH